MHLFVYICNGTVDVAKVDVIVFLSMRVRNTKFCTLEVASKIQL